MRPKLLSPITGHGGWAYHEERRVYILLYADSDDGEFFLVAYIDSHEAAEWVPVHEVAFGTAN